MNEFTGTPALTRAALRREWLRLTLWVVGLGLMMTLMAAVVRDLTGGTDEGTRAFVQLYVVNPVMRMFGLASGATIGAFTLTRVYIMIAILVALMSIFAVVRNTRANEDLGRTELIGSLAVGRNASLAAALILVVGANLLLAVLITLALLINHLDPLGAITAGASIGAVGISFAGVAAVTAQLADNARKANGLAALIMGATALLSSIGNMIGQIDEVALRVEPAWPAWFSPFGWGQLMRPFDTNEWWPLILLIASFAALVTLALYLENRRDVGQGILPQRRGPPTAGPLLSSTYGLTLRQQSGIIIGWLLALIALGAVYGAVSSEIETLMEDMEEARELFEQIGGTEAILDGYLSAVAGITGLFVTIFVIQTLLRARHEEIHGPLESLLATATSRTRWLNAHLANAVVASPVILLAAGLAMGITAGLVLHDLAGYTVDITLATLAKLPSVLVFAALTLLAYGAWPRRSTLLIWGLFVIALLTGPMFGPLFDLPQWAMDLSPFTHVAGPPATDYNHMASLALVAVAIILWSLAMVLFRRRDLEIH